LPHAEVASPLPRYMWDGSPVPAFHYFRNGLLKIKDCSYMDLASNYFHPEKPK